MILVIYLILTSIISSYSQVYDSTRKMVELPLKKYKAIRVELISQKRLIFNKNRIISIKDSIITNDSLKSLSYLREIENKNHTIDTLSREYYKLNKEYTKEKKSILNNYKSWVGLTIGLVLGIFIIK